ncbi:hypothetical protein FRC07_008493 [Ceratobasidium sp. 392]|nr:hypothetical protein FRC07_008493 [Ceratobasidium sp. 392]
MVKHCIITDSNQWGTASIPPQTESSSLQGAPTRIRNRTGRLLPDWTTTNTEGCYHPAGIASARFSYELLVGVIADDVDWAAEKVKSHLEALTNISFTIKHLKLVVRNRWGFGSRDRNISTWVNLIPPTESLHQLESLYLAFEPPLVRNPVKEQQDALRLATCLMPNLAYVVLGAPGLEWRRPIEEECNPASGLPDWTPCPNCSSSQVLRWWLDALDISMPMGAGTEGLGRVATQMWGIMRTRWDDRFLPSVETLQERLSTIATD